MAERTRLDLRGPLANHAHCFHVLMNPTAARQAARCCHCGYESETFTMKIITHGPYEPTLADVPLAPPKETPDE